MAVASVLLWQGANVRYNFGGNWTGLFCTGDSQRVPPDLAAGTYRFQQPSGYDGQFYRYIAHDPLFRKGYSGFIDDARLRYRRLLVPGLAWLLAAGCSEWIDFTFIAVVVASIGMGVYWSGRYLGLRGRHPGWGLVFLLTPAALTSMDRMLVDATLTALFAAFLCAAEEGSERRLYVLSMIACLTRETGFLMAGSCVLHWSIRRRYAKAACFATAGAPALAWYRFVALHTVGQPHAWGALRYALTGIFQRLLGAWLFRESTLGIALSTIDAFAVLGLVASFVLAGYWCWRRQPGLVQISVLLFLGLGLVLGSPEYMAEAVGYGRPVSPLLLYVLLEAVRAGAWLALLAPLAVTLSVGVFFAKPLLRILRHLAP